MVTPWVTTTLSTLATISVSAMETKVFHLLRPHQKLLPSTAYLPGFRALWDICLTVGKEGGREEGWGKSENTQRVWYLCFSNPQGRSLPCFSAHQNHLWYFDTESWFSGPLWKYWFCFENQVLFSSHLVVLIVLKCCSESVRLSGFWTRVVRRPQRHKPLCSKGRGSRAGMEKYFKFDVVKLSLVPPVLLHSCRTVRRACNLLEPPHPTKEAFLAGLRIKCNRACDSTLETVEC